VREFTSVSWIFVGSEETSRSAEHFFTLSFTKTDLVFSTERAEVRTTMTRAELKAPVASLGGVG
jgi:hypothetical protein